MRKTQRFPDSRGTGSRGEFPERLQRVFDALSPGQRSALAKLWKTRALKAGDILWREGESSEDLGFLRDGVLALVKTLRDGQRHIIDLRVPPAMVGDASGGEEAFAVEALSDATLVTCNRAAFEDILSRSAEASELFMQITLDEIEAAREWNLVLSAPKAAQRVAAFLAILCRSETGDAVPIRLAITIRRKDLAQYLGMRQESLSRAFHDLEARGIIRLRSPSEFDVIDRAGLFGIAGDVVTRDL